MKSSDNNDLLRLGENFKQGYSSVIANAGKIIATITLAIAVLVTFTDVALSKLGGEQFTTTLAVMLLSSYMIYFSLEDSGEREGERSHEYIAAEEKYLAVRSKITPDMIDSMRQFCHNYSMNELGYRRLSYLGENGYSLSDFNAYKGGKSFSLKAKRIFKRAEKMKAVCLTPATLLSRSHGWRKSELTDPVYKKITFALLSLIPTTVCMIFTLSVILSAKEGQNIYTILDGLLKLSALPIVGFKGAIDGYRFSKDDKSSWLETKARLLDSFLTTQ